MAALVLTVYCVDFPGKHERGSILLVLFYAAGVRAEDPQITVVHPDVLWVAQVLFWLPVLWWAVGIPGRRRRAQQLHHRRSGNPAVRAAGGRRR